jgi:hypothetical protein
MKEPGTNSSVLTSTTKSLASIHQYEHKGGDPWLEFLKNERSKYPIDERVYVIQDNLNSHWTHDIKSWAGKSKVTLVPTAINASWMNQVECHTSDIQNLALSGTNYKSWDEVNKAF